MIDQNLLFTIVPAGRKSKSLFVTKQKKYVLGPVVPEISKVQQGFSYEEVGKNAQDINGCCHKRSGGNSCVKIQTF